MKRDVVGVAASRSGFTLVEVLLVIAILGILAGTLMVNVGGKSEKARINSARASIGALTSAVQTFQIDLARLPGELGELFSDPGDPNWQGPYLMGSKDAMVDPWGTPFSISKSGGSFKISSAGPDKSMGTEDDITSF
jgi:general secretion pathway protein G